MQQSSWSSTWVSRTRKYLRMVEVWITWGAHGRSVVKPYKSVILILLYLGELFGNVAVAFICYLLGGTIICVLAWGPKKKSIKLLWGIDEKMKQQKPPKYLVSHSVRQILTLWMGNNVLKRINLQALLFKSSLITLCLRPWQWKIKIHHIYIQGSGIICKFCKINHPKSTVCKICKKNDLER